jgi:hypothetical protein
MSDERRNRATIALKVGKERAGVFKGYVGILNQKLQFLDRGSIADFEKRRFKNDRSSPRGKVTAAVGQFNT